MAVRPHSRTEHLVSIAILWKGHPGIFPKDIGDSITVRKGAALFDCWKVIPKLLHQEYKLDQKKPVSVSILWRYIHIEISAYSFTVFNFNSSER